MKAVAINICAYQAVWALCVFFGNFGALISLPILAGHLLFMPHRREDLQMMGLLLLTGCIVDGMLHFFGLISFTETNIPIPIWLMVIWLALALLPNHSLNWMKGRPMLSSAFGAIGGPLAYWAGVKAGAAEFGQALLPSILLLGLIWTLIWPAAMQIAQKLLPAYSMGKKKTTTTAGAPHDHRTS